MKTHWMAFVLGAALAVLMVGFSQQLITRLSPNVSAQAVPQRGRVCSSTFVVGAYALTLEGSIVSGSNPGPYAGVGVLTLDGISNATLTISQNYNGTIRPVVTVAGTYNVAANCSGTLVMNDGSRFEFVTSDSSREISLLQNITTGVVRGTAKRQ
jgi:hypothetical protein